MELSEILFSEIPCFFSENMGFPYSLLHSSKVVNDRTIFNPLSAKPAKWSNTLKQFVGLIGRLLPTNCLSVFHHFVGLVLKWLIEIVECLLNETIRKNYLIC